MQNISNDVITVLESNGLTLSFDAEKGLKVIPKEKITADCRAYIIENKAQIIARLTDREKVRETPVEESKPVVQIKDRPGYVRPSPVALAWLREHRQALDDAGWTRAELYRRNKYKQGIAWLKLWEEAFCRAFLHDDGIVEFECSMHGRDFFQTARPASMLAAPVQRKKKAFKLGQSGSGRKAHVHHYRVTPMENEIWNNNLRIKQ